MPDRSQTLSAVAAAEAVCSQTQKASHCYLDQKQMESSDSHQEVYKPASSLSTLYILAHKKITVALT